MGIVKLAVGVGHAGDDRFPFVLGKFAVHANRRARHRLPGFQRRDDKIHARFLFHRTQAQIRHLHPDVISELIFAQAPVADEIRAWLPGPGNFGELFLQIQPEAQVARLVFHRQRH